MKSAAKLVTKLSVLLLAVITSGQILGQDSRYLPPIIDLVLQESKLSRLEQVLNAYENPNSQHIFVAAHRGGKEFDAAEGIPGNSIANIDNAISKGFDLYESDIEILGDETLVVFHDNYFNNLTNTEAAEMDFLDNATLAYAKSLFLTYDNGGGVSDQRIPTLEEFLTAAKGKIMVKFDLKSGTFDGPVLQRIFDTVVATETIDQVLIRGGSSALSFANQNGYARMLMRRYNAGDEPTVTEINDLVANYDVRAISIPDGADAAVIAAANAAGLVVEIHELSDFTDQQRADAINQGVRQFHSFAPSLLLDYLQLNGHREF